MSRKQEILCELSACLSFAPPARNSNELFRAGGAERKDKLAKG